MLQETSFSSHKFSLTKFFFSRLFTYTQSSIVKQQWLIFLFSTRVYTFYKCRYILHVCNLVHY